MMSTVIVDFTYLKLINDQNPIHAHIVPGQMIVQMALQSQRLQMNRILVID
jgi:hypothetical protein